MNISKSRLYALAMIACFAGYLWLYYNLTALQAEKQTIEVCLFKSITHIPCPSCGSTGAVIALIHGELIKSLSINPFGILITVIMLIMPAWILFDIITAKKTFFDFFKQTEVYLKKPGIAIPLVLFVLINWIWNIIKSLDC